MVSNVRSAPAAKNCCGAGMRVFLKAFWPLRVEIEPKIIKKHPFCTNDENFTCARNETFLSYHCPIENASNN
jgi:hypothetical protein